MIEGYLIKYRNYLWVVKGCEHFNDYVIAYPRYDIVNQLKIKSMDRALSIARKLEVMRYSDCLKLEVPLLRRDEVEEVLNPFNRGLWPDLPQEVNLILEGLNPNELGEVGLTGSYLISTLLKGIKPRDVDLIIKDVGVGFKVYEKLKEFRWKGITKPLEGIDEFEGCDLKTRVMLLRSRVLEGVIGNTVYSVRVLSCKEDVRPTCVEDYELFSGELTIVESVSSYVMPYTYIAESSLGRVLVRSLRMRYSEIPIGVRLLVSDCRLEKYFNNLTCINLDTCYASIYS